MNNPMPHCMPRRIESGNPCTSLARKRVTDSRTNRQPPVMTMASAVW